MLLVWLFALASGVAQACLASSSSAHARHGADCASIAPDAASAGLGADAAAGPDDAAPWKAACAKFCGDASAPTPKCVWADQIGSSVWLAVAPPPVMLGVPKGVAGAWQLSAPPWQAVRPSAPLPIVYLRLTL